MPTQSAPLIIEAPSLLDMHVIRDLTIDGQGDVALDISYPEANSHLWPTLYLQNIVIRGDWRVGIRLRNCWNATLIDPVITGLVTAETIARPKMEVGIDCGNSMDVHVIRPRVTCAQIGIRVADLDLDGHGEGFHVDRGWLMHVGTGIKLEGFGSGGWPTPFAELHGLHIAHLDVGIDARKYFDVKISGMNLYGTEVSRYPLGIYAEDCRTVALGPNNTFWQNKPAVDGVAIALTRVNQARIDGNMIEPCYLAGAVIDPECRKVRLGSNEWSGLPLYDLRPSGR